jgi:epoxide hydrolase-like predicted phosphatase
MTRRRLAAVIFDLGGVVVGSPLAAIAGFERERGIPAGFVNRVVVDTGAAGAWSRLERGELDLERFYLDFGIDCERAGHALSARALMERIAVEAAPRPAMLAAIARIRERGLKAAALTNNWAGEGEGEGDGGLRDLRGHFDVFVESCALGLRKPDPRIYRFALDALAVAPEQAAFLDDIGRNLKTARELGMATIKVEDPDRALAELEELVGFGLRDLPAGQ